MKLLFFGVFIGLISCQSAEKDPLIWEKQNLNREHCLEGNCARVKLAFPVFSEPEFSDAINRDIKGKIQSYFFTDSANLGLEERIDRFIDGFSDYKEQFPEVSGDWEIEVKSEVTYLSDSLISIFFEYYEFTGGAHPNSTVSFLNFDGISGEVMDGQELIPDQNKLMELAEEAFRRHHQLGENQDLRENNQFFIPDTGFFLPQAMGFKDEKFWLIYSPYEIGPYVMGYTELSFDLQNLKGIVKQ